VTYSEIRSTAHWAVTADVRVVDMGGKLVASASSRGGRGQLGLIARNLVRSLAVKMPEKGVRVAVVTFSNRTKNAAGNAAAMELADKVLGAMIDTHSFVMMERIRLSKVLDERDVMLALGGDLAGTADGKELRRKIRGARYLILGAVSAPN